MARSQRSVPAVHPERDALMRAILANPDDDLPKLVYADWQEEHGDPLHAELIRLLLERSRISADRPIDLDEGRCKYPPEYAARGKVLENRLTFFRRRPRYRSLFTFDGFNHLFVDVGKTRPSRVLDKNELRWFPGCTVEYDWDTVESVWPSFNRHADRPLLECFGREHWIWRVNSATFEGSRLTPGSLRSLCSSSGMPGFWGVIYERGSVDADDFADFLVGTGSTWISNLVFSGTRFTEQESGRPSHDALMRAIERLASSPLAKSLKVVVLDSPEITEKVARFLLDDSAFPAVHYLDFGRKRLSQDIRKRVQERQEHGH